MILAIDPGPEKSGFVQFDREQIRLKGLIENRHQIGLTKWPYTNIVIECPSSYGMAVGQTIFDTCILIGMLIKIGEIHNIPTHLIFRQSVKFHLCNSTRAKQAEIRQALIDRFGPDNTKKNPNSFYHPESGKMNAHTWDALALAVTFCEEKTYDWKYNENKLSNFLKPYVYDPAIHGC